MQPHHPTLSIEAISLFLRDVFGVDGEVSVLEAERDLNVRVKSATGDLLLKILPSDEGREQADPLTAALRHIAQTAPVLLVPRVHASRSGNYVEAISDGRITAPTVLLSWLPGHLMADNQLTTPIRRDLGAKLALLGKAMRGFMHPAIATRQLVWNMMNADQHLKSVDLLEDPVRINEARSFLDHYRQHIKPVLNTLRCQIIHGDVHPWNVIAGDDGKLKGIIDFGDMIYGALVIDPVNSISDCLHGEADLVPVFRDIVSGYADVTELEEAEADLIPDLVGARLISTAIIARARDAAGVGHTASIANLSNSSLATFDKVRAQRAALIDACRAAAGFSRLGNRGNSLERRKAAMGPKPLLFYDPPLHMVHGEGMWLTASDGQRYLDCYNNVPHVGHANRRVARAVAHQLQRLNTNTRYLTDQSVEYAERLKATLHPSLDTVVFVNSGSEANDVAIRMAEAWTRKSGGVCMESAYHGVTKISDAISPSNYPAGKWHAPHIRLLEAPDMYRGPWRQSGSGFDAHHASIVDGALADLTTSGFGCAFGIVDSAFMSNGIPDVPLGYVKAMVEKIRGAGGLFIADEVQSGFGRMGTAMWGHQHHGVVPDFVTIGKPAGNGFPIGVIITRAEILACFTENTGPFFSTFGGGNAACAAGLAVLDIIRDDDLVDAARDNGEALRSGFRNLAKVHKIIGDVRGSGLAIGVELVRNRETLEPADRETLELLNLVRDHGVLIGRDGKFGNVLKIRPPLVFAKEHVEIVVGAIDKALTQLESQA